MHETGESSQVRDEEPREIHMDMVYVGHTIVPDQEIPLAEGDLTPEAEHGEFQDIPVDTEQLQVTEPEVETEDDPEEDQAAVFGEEPEVGRVLRSYSDDEEPVGVRAERLQIERDELLTRLTEMIAQFEWEMADKIRVSGEWMRSSRQVSELTEARLIEGQYLRQIEGQLMQAETRADRHRTERDAARAELQAVREELAREGEIRDLFHDAWVRAATRDDTDDFTLDTAMGRLRSRIRRFPREEDLSGQVINRRSVDQ